MKKQSKKYKKQNNVREVKSSNGNSKSMRKIKRVDKPSIVKLSTESTGKTILIPRNVLNRTVVDNEETNHKLNMNLVLMYAYLLTTEGYVNTTILKDQLKLNVSGASKLRSLFEKKIVSEANKLNYYYKAVRVASEDVVKIDREIILTNQLSNNDKKVYLSAAAIVNPDGKGKQMKLANLKLNSCVSTGAKQTSSQPFIHESINNLRRYKLIEVITKKDGVIVPVDFNRYSDISKNTSIAVGLGASGKTHLKSELEFNYRDLKECEKKVEEVSFTEAELMM